MIFSVGKDLWKGFLAFCEESPSAYTAKLSAAAAAYGWERPFLRFWIQEKDGKPIAAIGKIDGEVTVAVKEGAWTDELTEFLDMIGHTHLICDGEMADSLGEPAQKGTVLRSSNVLTGVQAEWNPPVREVYTLLEQCRSEKFPVPDFEPFYLDLSHRMRHDSARVAVLREQGNLTAGAIAVYGTHSAVLSAVAVAPGCRGTGRGKAVVSALAASLNGLERYVLCHPELSAFYESMGFLPCGRWAVF